MRRGFVFALAALVLALDQASKHWAVVSLADGRAVGIVPRYFALSLTTNTGAAFGMFQSSTPFLGLIALAAGLAIAVYIIGFSGVLSAYVGFALGLTLGGACGNFLDRIRLHYVVDFISVHLGTYQWPIFNIADSAICVGVVMLAIRYAGHTSRTDSAQTNNDRVHSEAEPSLGASE
jgi:signal peptidase II